MKKYILSLSLIIVFTFYVLLESQNSISVVSNKQDNASDALNTPGTNIPAAPASPTPAVGETKPAGATSAAPSSPSAKPTPTVVGLYNNGSYAGDSVDAYFGNVQVKAVVSGGKLTDVKVLTYPQDRGTSIRINNSALPKLIQEAIVSQSAQVDIVSGATQTSQGFAQSLASALAKAKN